MKKFLHVGCGTNTKINTAPGFNRPDWEEIRFDIDPSVNPDFIGTMTDMSAIETGTMDALFSSHNIEHIFPYEVPLALGEFYRVLKPDGFVFITCPDLDSACKAIAEKGISATLYNSPIGPVCGLDILYGHQASISRGNHFMGHRGGFTGQTLAKALMGSGFKGIFGTARPEFYDLWLLGFKVEHDQDFYMRFVTEYLDASSAAPRY